MATQNIFLNGLQILNCLGLGCLCRYHNYNVYKRNHDTGEVSSASCFKISLCKIPKVCFVLKINVTVGKFQHLFVKFQLQNWKFLSQVVE